MMVEITEDQKLALSAITMIGQDNFTPQEWIEALELLLKLSKETFSEQST